MTPFILRDAIPIPPETLALPEHVYDLRQQLWLDLQTGVPLVLSDIPANASTYGETTNKRTREGADQINCIYASTYGETVLTKTNEGTDQTEIATMQKLDIDAPYSHF